jgi:hypothetical protein
VNPCPPLALPPPPAPRVELTRAELDAITEQLSQLDRAELESARQAKAPAPPEQLSLPFDLPARGALLCSLARSKHQRERERAHTIVRTALEQHGSTVPTAAALGVSERWIQTLIKNNPALCQGLALRKPGRPPTPKDDSP